MTSGADWTWGELLGVAHRWRPDGAQYAAFCGQARPIEDRLQDDGSAAVCPVCDTDRPAAIDVLPGSRPAGGLEALALVELCHALDQQAQQLQRQPIGPSTLFSIPAGLPDRLLAPVDLLVAGRWQPRQRFDSAGLDDLAESIRQHGVLTALKVFANEQGRLELIAGERRLRAAQQAGLRMLPVELCAYTQQRIAEISAIDNLQRVDLEPLEEGAYYSKMIDQLAISEAELSRRLGRNRAYIQQRRLLASAAPDLQAAYRAGDLSFSQARAIVLAAPGLVDLQQVAYKAVRKQIEASAHLSESDARRVAEAAIVKRTQKALEAMGWSINSSTSRVLVFGGAEAPAAWSSADMAAAVKAGRRPAGQAPAPLALDQAQRALLDRHGFFNYGGYDPWFVLHRGAEYLIKAPGDMPALLEQLAQEWRDLQQAYQAAGWALEHVAGNSFKATSDQGRIEQPWRWDGACKLLDDIQRGALPAEPSKAQQQAAQQQYRQTCARCYKKTAEYDYLADAGGYLCKACYKTAKIEIAQAKGAARRLVAAQLQPGLEALPVEALRLLASCISARNTFGDQRASSAGKIRAASAAQLIAQLVDRVAAEVYTDRACPVVEVDQVDLLDDLVEPPAPAAMEIAA